MYDNDLSRIIEEKIKDLRRRLGRKAPELESAIRQALTECTRKSREVLPLECDFVAESLIVQHEHPGEFVVFTESTEDREGRARHVISVLFSSKSWEKARGFMKSLAEDAPQNAVVEFQPNP